MEETECQNCITLRQELIELKKTVKENMHDAEKIVNLVDNVYKNLSEFNVEYNRNMRDYALLQVEYKNLKEREAIFEKMLANMDKSHKKIEENIKSFLSTPQPTLSDILRNVGTNL